VRVHAPENFYGHFTTGGINDRIELTIVGRAAPAKVRLMTFRQRPNKVMIGGDKKLSEFGSTP